MDADDFLVSVQTHIHENIKFADGKAIAFVAIDSGVVAALFANKMLFVSRASVALIILSVATFGALVAAIILCALVIWPRGLAVEDGVEGGKLTIPQKIAFHYDAHDYARAVKGAAPHDLTHDLASIVLARARVNRRKYELLKWAIGLSLLGLFASGLFVLWLSLSAAR